MNYSPRNLEEDIADLKARIAADVIKRGPTEARQRDVKDTCTKFLKKVAAEARKDLFVRTAAVIGCVLVVGTALSVANT